MKGGLSSLAAVLVLSGDGTTFRRCLGFAPCPPARSSSSSRSFHHCRVVERRSSSRDDDDPRGETPRSAAAAAETSPSSGGGGGVRSSFRLTLPPCRELERLRTGEFVASEPFRVPTTTTDDDPNDVDGGRSFRALLYPRGGGGRSSSRVVGGGARATIDSWFRGPGSFDETAAYLQYLPASSSSSSSDDDHVDATFTLRLKGAQRSGPRFDVEWSSGMRFVPSERSRLSEGRANDFGASLMRADLLSTFLGADDDDDDHRPTEMEVDATVFSSGRLSARRTIHENDAGARSSSSTLFGLAPGKDVRGDEELARVGRIVVPVLRSLSQRPRLFEIGAYPGVDYRIMRVFAPSGEEIFASVPGADYELKPVYPLVDQLERDWPVRVNESEIPKLVTSGAYNVLSAAGSLVAAVAGLAATFLASRFLVSLLFIPSRSMEPALRAGDVLLVEKVTPRATPARARAPGAVVLFAPPPALRDVVARSGGAPLSDRDLFVKRVAAVAGDVVSVSPRGDATVNGAPAAGARDACDAEPLRLIERYVTPTDVATTVPDDQLFVLGDCGAVSVDSRVWGFLDANRVVGRPVVRVWPPGRVGPVPSLPPSTTDATN